MNLKKKISRNLRFLSQYYKDSKAAKGSQVKLYNYQWVPRDYRKHWLTQFIVNRNLLPINKNDSISIFSVNGNPSFVNLNKSKYKIFYTAENVHEYDTFWNQFEDLYLENKNVNLSIGFDYIDNDKYIRVPYWLMTMFPANADYKTIKSICDKLNKPDIDLNTRKAFCSFICRYDYFGDRTKMLNKINSIETVHCAGDFMHNNDDLKVKYKDDKLEYLKNYKFNLCPENTNYEGYVTEKLFEAIYSGCIPIYWGSNNNPEPEVLNHAAIIFIDNQDFTNLNQVEIIKELINNEEKYVEFASQNRLKDNAADYIYSIYIALESKLKGIIK